MRLTRIYTRNVKGCVMMSPYVPMDDDDVTTMFIFLGVSLGALFVIYGLMYRHALGRREFLRLDEFEIYQTETWAFVWFGSIGVCALGVILAVVLDGDWIPFAGFSFSHCWPSAR